MTELAVVLEDLRERTLEDVLREVLARGETLTVRLPEGGEVAIQPVLGLKPLPDLEGSVPEGWKDAICRQAV
jgi:hypothetical protein